MSKIKTAVIGVGYLGRFHAMKYAAMEDVDFLGVVDIDKARAGEIAREVGTKAFTQPDELLDELDAVSIAVPTSFHAEVAIPFLKRGIAVLLEKPISAQLSEARSIIAAAEESGAKLQIGHLERFNPALI
ncbi:Gfo/Idh/MocA family oxidoreductase, partial [bacterium]|nr:Gfo/Idh/MocA family oxidoreductase [bacterium]